MSVRPGLYFPIKKGDRLPYLQVQITNPDGTARDLTGQIFQFNMGKAGQAIKVNLQNMSGVSLAQGIIEYRWQVGDTDTVGLFEAEIVINGNETFPRDGKITVDVQDRVE